MESFDSPKGLPADLEKLVENGSVSELSSDPNFPAMPLNFRIDFDEYFAFCGENPENGPDVMKRFLEMKLAELNP